MNVTHPIRIALGFVNAWLFNLGESFVLVDSGLPSHRERLAAALRAEGCEPGRLALHILTHSDFDHAGNSSWLRESWGAKVAIHRGDVPALETGVMPPRRAIGKMSWLVAITQLIPRPAGPTCGVDIVLEDGKELAPWGLDAKVWHFPGHTAGSVGILTPAGDFVAGDLVSNWRRPGPGILASDIEAYRRSLEKARSLVPANGTVFPGHGSPFPAKDLDGIKV